MDKIEIVIVTGIPSSVQDRTGLLLAALFCVYFYLTDAVQETAAPPFYQQYRKADQHPWTE